MNNMVVIAALLIFFAFAGWGLQRHSEQQAELVRELNNARIEATTLRMKIRYTCRRHPRLNMCRKPSIEREALR